MTLEGKTCEPCKGGVPPLSTAESEDFLKQIPDWSLIDNNTKISRTFETDDFNSALRIVNKVGEIADTEDHHPDISFGWGYCKVILYTHKINGLHENDFIMAAKISNIVN